MTLNHFAVFDMISGSAERDTATPCMGSGHVYTALCPLTIPATPPSLCGLFPLQPCVSLGTQSLSKAVGLSRERATRWGHTELIGQPIHGHSRKNVALLSSEAENSKLFLASFPVVWSLSVCPSAESGQMGAKQRDEKQMWGEEEGEGRGGKSRGALLPLVTSPCRGVTTSHSCPNVPISFAATRTN